MKTSAGILLISGNKILLGHATMSPRYDIPKGIIEAGESPAEAMIRETKEEFNIDITNYEDLGLFKYIPGKDLHLFEASIFDSSDLKCSSYFERKGKRFPEIDGYKWFDLDEELPVAKGLKKIINQLNSNGFTKKD